jgi:hypothetical protein
MWFAAPPTDKGRGPGWGVTAEQHIGLDEAPVPGSVLAVVLSLTPVYRRTHIGPPKPDTPPPVLTGVADCGTERCGTLSPDPTPELGPGFLSS